VLVPVTSLINTKMEKMESLLKQDIYFCTFIFNFLAFISKFFIIEEDFKIDKNTLIYTLIEYAFTIIMQGKITMKKLM
jgi:hypothetical protein